MLVGHTQSLGIISLIQLIKHKYGNFCVTTHRTRPGYLKYLFGHRYSLDHLQNLDMILLQIRHQ